MVCNTARNQFHADCSVHLPSTCKFRATRWTRMRQRSARPASTWASWKITLEQRNAYLMVKGAMEHPELIRTQENPVAPRREFPFGEKYYSLEALTEVMKA